MRSVRSCAFGRPGEKPVTPISSLLIDLGERSPGVKDSRLLTLFSDPSRESCGVAVGGGGSRSKVTLLERDSFAFELPRERIGFGFDASSASVSASEEPPPGGDERTRAAGIA